MLLSNAVQEEEGCLKLLFSSLRVLSVNSMRQVNHQNSRKRAKKRGQRRNLYCTIFCSYDGQGIRPPPSFLKLDYLFALTKYFFLIE